MLQLLSGFAALSLLSGTLMALLPQGSLRRTAAMVTGLMMLLYWSGGLQQLLGSISLTSDTPAPLLTGTGLTLPDITQEVSP